MPNIEVACLVLGVIPITLNCLDYYGTGCDLLEEWWMFKARFIEFVDLIDQERMNYERCVMLLLDPMISDNNKLQALTPTC